MEDLQLQEMYVYPIKSLGGISVPEAEVQQTGLQHDRQWMLTDNEGNFLSQRTFPQLALLQVNIDFDCLIVTHKNNLLSPLTIPFNTGGKKKVMVSIWDDVCTALEVSVTANHWFSDALQMPAKLVYMPADTHRLVDENYANNKEIVSFADAYPFVIIGQSSLNDLNLRLDEPVAMNRFRPNLVFTGGAPYCEDTFDTFSIGDITFTAVKPCARCVLTTIDQELATKGKEPLKTLSGYRMQKNKVMFGQNLLHTGAGLIKVGDKIKVQRLKSHLQAKCERV
jgi:uncharacterized protein YcbX